MNTTLTTISAASTAFDGASPFPTIESLAPFLRHAEHLLEDSLAMSKFRTALDIIHEDFVERIYPCIKAAACTQLSAHKFQCTVSEVVRSTESTDACQVSNITVELPSGVSMCITLCNNSLSATRYQIDKGNIEDLCADCAQFAFADYDPEAPELEAHRQRSDFEITALFRTLLLAANYTQD